MLNLGQNTRENMVYKIIADNTEASAPHPSHTIVSNDGLPGTLKNNWLLGIHYDSGKIDSIAGGRINERWKPKFNNCDTNY